MGLLDGGMEGMADLGVIGGLLSGRQQNWPMLLQQLVAQKAAMKNREQEMKMRQETHGLNQEQSRMQIDRMRRQSETEGLLRNASSQAFAPPQEAHGPMESGQGAPMLPGGGGPEEYVRRAMQIDPLEGMKARQQFAKESPFAKVDPKDYTPESLQKYARSQNVGDLVPFRKPEGPQAGQTREVKTGGKIYTYEWDGKTWKKIADAPQWKPESGGDKAPKPQLYDGPNGPVWITPPGGGGGGAVPVTGPDGRPLQSKQSAKAAAEVEKSGERTRNAVQRVDMILGKVSEAVNQSGFTTTGALGAINSKVPGTSARNLASTLETIKANIGFAELQAMREASPTGGALGQVAVQELNALQSVLGSLDQTQGQDQLRKNLYAIEKHFQGWKRAVQQSQQQPQGGGGFKYLGTED